MRRAITGALFLLLLAFAAQAQQQPIQGMDPNAPAKPQPAANPAQANQEKPPDTNKATKPPAPFVHDFWDRENDWLFAGVFAGRALDFASTLNLRARGIKRRELLVGGGGLEEAPVEALRELGQRLL